MEPSAVFAICRYWAPKWIERVERRRQSQLFCLNQLGIRFHWSDRWKDHWSLRFGDHRFASKLVQGNERSLPVDPWKWYHRRQVRRRQLSLADHYSHSSMSPFDRWATQVKEMKTDVAAVTNTMMKSMLMYHDKKESMGKEKLFSSFCFSSSYIHRTADHRWTQRRPMPDEIEREVEVIEFILSWRQRVGLPVKRVVVKRRSGWLSIRNADKNKLSAVDSCSPLYARVLFYK